MEIDFLTRLIQHSKFKERSEKTYHTIHLPELNERLNLNLSLPPLPTSAPENDPFAAQPDLQNKNKIEVIYLGNSMLERLKTTGKCTRLAQFSTSWNAGCGGDKNANVAHRLSQGMYSVLRKAQEQAEERRTSNCNIKAWVLVSGTNDLRPKRSFVQSECESYKVLIDACLRIAPGSRVLACAMFYRKDIADEIVDESNGMLKKVVEKVNEELVRSGGEEQVRWVEAPKRLGKEMLVDHVHLNEEGYTVWDEMLWPLVAEAVGTYS